MSFYSEKDENKQKEAGFGPYFKRVCYLIITPPFHGRLEGESAALADRIEDQTFRLTLLFEKWAV